MKVAARVASGTARPRREVDGYWFGNTGIRQHHTQVGLNAALKMKLLPESELTALEGKLFRVRVRDAGGIAHFTYHNGLFRPPLRIEREPDLAFAAHLSAYLQLLARQKVPDTLFFNRELEITGDTELGLIVKNMLDAVEWPSLPRLPLPSR